MIIFEKYRGFRIMGLFSTLKQGLYGRAPQRKTRTVKYLLDRFFWGITWAILLLGVFAAIASVISAFNNAT
jgi:hypothetical protein